MSADKLSNEQLIALAKQRGIASPAGDELVLAENIPEFRGRTAPIGDRIAAEAGMLLSTSPQDQAEILAKQMPGAKFQLDADGNILVDYNGERGYLNKPGASLRDFASPVAQGAAFMATGGGSIWPQIAKNVGMSLALDAGADAAGAESPQYLQNAAMAGGGTAAADMFMRTVVPRLANAGAAVARMFSRNPALVRMTQDGLQLSDEGIALANQLGVDPEDFAPALQRGFRPEQFDDPAQALLLDQSNRFDFPMRQWEATVEPQARLAQYTRQEELANDITTPAGRVFQESEQVRDQKGRELMARQQQQFAGSAQPVRSELDASDFITGRVKEEHGALKAQVDAAYDAARDAGGAFSVQAYQEIPQTMNRVMREFGFNPNLHPAAAEVRKGFIQMAKLAKSRVNLRDIDIRRMENMRRQMLQAQKSAKPGSPDALLIGKMINAFDDWQGQALDRALFTGDDQALELYRNARRLRAKRGELYEIDRKVKGGDPAGRTIEKLVANDADTMQSVNMIYGLGKIGNRQESVATIKRLEKIFGRDSREMGALREAAWLRIIDPAVSGQQFNPAALAKSLGEALDGRGAMVTRRLFTKEQHNELRAMQRFFSQMIPPGKGAVSSGTAERASRFIQSAAKRAGFMFGATGDFSTGAALLMMGNVNKFIDWRAAKSAVSPAAQAALPSAGSRAAARGAAIVVPGQLLQGQEQPQQ